ncbi:MAG TPA: glutathione peroxidase [Tissierellia bacterium]|nr:glutathione peroxidase [Tissierellia bacterium]
MSIYDFNVENMSGDNISLNDYRDQVVLIVNTATQCGLTPQYEGLQKLYEDYHERGFEILDFPSNQFLEQAPEDNEGIRSFCQLNFGTEYDQFSKIDVNGDQAHPLFSFLKRVKPEDKPNEETEGFLTKLKELGQERPGSDIKWNFTKFLIDRRGNVVERYAPNIKPEELAKDIEKLL